MVDAGQQLRSLREQLGLTVRDVETASAKLASRHGNPEYAIPISRLSDIETKDIVPSVYKIYSLAVIYRRTFNELLAWYGIDLGQAAHDSGVLALRQSHLLAPSEGGLAKVPVRMDPSFDLRKTANLGRMIERWVAAGRVQIDAVDVRLAREFLEHSGCKVEDLPGGSLRVSRKGRGEEMSREGAVVEALRRLAARE